MKNKKIMLLAATIFSLGALVGCGGPKMYTVTFDTEGGSVVAPVQVEENKAVARPATNPTPTNPNYGFEDWYDAKTAGNVYNFDSLIKKDTTIYARFGKRPELIAAKAFRNYTINEGITKDDFIVQALYCGEVEYQKVSNFTIDGFNDKYVFTDADVTAGTKSFTVRYKSGGQEKTASCVFSVQGYKVDFYTATEGNGYAVKANASKSSNHVVIPSRAKASEVTKNVTEVKQEAFDGNAYVTAFSIGGNIERIYSAAFRNCTSLADIYWDWKGGDVFISVSAFYGLTNLQTIHFNGTKDEWNNYVGQHCETGWRTGSTFTITCKDGVVSFN